MRAEGDEGFPGEAELFKKATDNHGRGSEPVRVPYENGVIGVHISGKCHGQSRARIVFPFLSCSAFRSGMFGRIGFRSLYFKYVSAYGGMDHPGHGPGIAGMGKIRDQDFARGISRSGSKRCKRKNPRRHGESGQPLQCVTPGMTWRRIPKSHMFFHNDSPVTMTFHVMQGIPYIRENVADAAFPPYVCSDTAYCRNR